MWELSVQALHIPEAGQKGKPVQLLDGKSHTFAIRRAEVPFCHIRAF